MIRAARHSDIPRIIELGTILHQTTDYAALDFDADKVGNFMSHLIAGAGVVFVSEINGVVVGGMAGGIVDQWFNNDLIAYDYSIFVEPGRRNGVIAMRLIRAFEEWARLKGAKQIYMGIGTGVNVEGTSRLYESLGLKHFGPLFIKEL